MRKSVPKGMKRNRKPFGKAAKDFICYLPIFLMLSFFAFILVAPLVWSAMSAFKSNAEIMSFPPKFAPLVNSLKENWASVRRSIDIVNFIKNSLIYSVFNTLPAVFINTLAGYAFARFRFKGKNVIFMIFLATMMIPFQVIMVPVFLEVYYFGWLNTFWGLIVPKIASAYWIFMARAAFQGLPVEMEDAARIDGCSEMAIYWRIMVPLVKPIVITLLILNFNNCWNDLMWPMIVANATKMRTLSNGLAVFIGDRTTNYGEAFLCTTISVLPMLILYLFGQRYFVKGQAMSGIKG